MLIIGLCAKHTILTSVCVCGCCRYLNWKHQTLSHLDYFAALFGVMYLAVLLKRSCSEPTTLFYCLVIIIKVLPHVPLILGFSRFFFR